MSDLLRRLLVRRSEPLPPGLRRGLLAVAVVVVVTLAVAAWRELDLAPGDLNWWAVVVLLLVTAPVSLLLRAAEFDASARLVGERPSFGEASGVAFAASVANLLPLPGSLLVNVKALSRTRGYGLALAASTVPGALWVGLVAVMGGVAIAVGGAPIVGAAVVVFGAVVLGVAGLMFVRTTAGMARTPLALRVLIVELGYLGISVARLSLALAALRVDASLDQILALSVAGALTVAVGFFPAGLGIREVLVGALAPLVGLPFAVGVLVGVLDRMVWLTFLAVTGLGGALQTRSSSSDLPEMQRNSE